MVRTLKEWEACKPESVEFTRVSLYKGMVLRAKGRVKATGLPLSWSCEGKCVWQKYDIPFTLQCGRGGCMSV